jgi:hypothetical protein
VIGPKQRLVTLSVDEQPSAPTSIGALHNP